MLPTSKVRFLAVVAPASDLAPELDLLDDRLPEHCCQPRRNQATSGVGNGPRRKRDGDLHRLGGVGLGRKRRGDYGRGRKRVPEGCQEPVHRSDSPSHGETIAGWRINGTWKLPPTL